MSKKVGIVWGKASDELKAKVKHVLQMAQNNRYSVSRIYAAHNAVFDLSEEPQTCSTCLTSRVSALRNWWHANVPKDTDAVPTTGEKHTEPEATTYEEVLAKYGITFDEASEGDVLQTFITAGASEPREGFKAGITANEFALLEARFNDITAQHHADDFANRVTEKLAALGVVEGESTDDEILEALEVLAEAEGNAEDEQAFFNAQIEIQNRRIAANNAAVAFTPDSEGAQFGIATKGGQPLPAGNYDHEEQQYAVNGNEGRYTVITGEPAKVRTFDMGADVMGMVFTPNADDATKGTVLNADGSKVKAGTYNAADGTVIAVQVNGKATIK